MVKNIFSSYFMVTLDDKIQPKNQPKYYCIYCHYGTCKKTNYDTHINSIKHRRVTDGYKKGQNSAEIQPELSHTQEDDLCVCCCGKQYKHRQGLWRHKQKCIQQHEKEENKASNSHDKNDKLIEYLIKENKEIKEMILEIVKNGSISNTNSYNNNTTNSHNKAFNLNFFLNETCKNAMNITDFVDSIKLQLSDLMDVGELGYVEGISKIIVKNLNNLDETIRPIHCTDKKRETMYIKDEGEWTKEDEKKSNLKKVINKVADKNIRLLPAFREKYPEYKNAYSKISDKYDKLVIEVMETDEEKKEKIIKNISKVTTIAEKLPVGS
jgi:hypothetical protein